MEAVSDTIPGKGRNRQIYLYLYNYIYLYLYIFLCMHTHVWMYRKLMDIFRPLLGLQTSANNLYGIPSVWSKGSRSLMSISRPWFQAPSCSAVQYTVTICSEPGCRPPAQGDTENTPMLRADWRKKQISRQRYRDDSSGTITNKMTQIKLNS